MSTYATPEQMAELFGEETLVHLTGGAGAIDVVALGAAIRAAQAEVDAYVGSVATLPLARVPEALRLHACSIAYWYLDVDAPTEGARERYRAAVRYLERVQDGRASLGLDADGAAVAQEGGVDVSAPPRVYTDARLARFTGP